MPPKFKRILKRVAIGFAFLLAGLLILNGVLAWRAQQRLNMKISELRAAGEPTTLQELAPEGILAEENGAAQLAAISGDLQAWGTQFLHEFEGSELGQSWGNYDTSGSLPSAAQVAVIEPILDEYPRILPAVDRAAAAQQYGSLLNYRVSSNQFLKETLADVQLKRGLANFVDAKMRTLATQGKRDDAVRLGVKMLQIVRHYDQDPCLVNYLVSIAIRGITFRSLNGVLQSGAVGKEARNELDTELAKQDGAKPLLRALRTERAVSWEFVQDGAPVSAKIFFWPLKNYQADIIDFYSQAIIVADHPWVESHDAIEEIQTKANSETVFIKLLAPTLKLAFIVENRNLVEIRSLQVLSALNGFLQANAREPASVQELGLPDAVVMDPFSGKPLKLKRLDQGWLVYSVYENGIDDGGNFKDMKDWGLGPPVHTEEQDAPGGNKLKQQADQ